MHAFFSSPAFLPQSAFAALYAASFAFFAAV
jgi:hypothetical protein